jgi:Xaa-Pro aminopeptidase
MHHLQRQRARELLREKQLDYALFAHPHSVTWLTGFAAPVQTGPNFFAGASPLVWYADGRFTLIVVDAFAEAAEPFGHEDDGTLVTYLGYTIEQPIDGLGHLLKALQPLWSNVKGNVGVELADVTAAVCDALRAAAPSATFTNISDWLKPLRMVKTEEELTKLRVNFRLTDIGQRAAREAVHAGQREIDVWEAAHTAIHQAAGCRVPMGNDCAVGYRQNNVGGWPLGYELRPNDSVIVDLSTIHYGYWSDSCNTYYVGEPTTRQAELRAIVAEALALGASLLKPGAVAKEIDQALRQFIARSGYAVYPHHSGHGVGLSGHEAPRIVPYNDEPLAAGMVIMLEPGIYLPSETGVRLEDAFLITQDGAERITTHLL